MISSITKICPTCGKEFTPKNNSRQKYCDSYKGGAKTCKTYASRIRNDKMDDFEVDTTNKTPTSINGTNKDIESLKEALKLGKSDARKLEEEYQSTYKKMNDEDGDKFIIKRSKNNIPYYDKMLSRNDINDEVKADFTIKKKEAIEELKEASNRLESYKKRMNELKEAIPEKRLSVFRLQEKYNDSVIERIATDGAMTAKQNKQLMDATTYYPFDSLLLEGGAQNFSCLDKLPQPFVVLMKGENNSGTTTLAIELCKELVDFFQFKVLYIGDIEQINTDFKETVAEKIDSDLFAYKAVTSKIDIMKLVQRGNYELLVIDKVNTFQINYKFIYDIQKQYKKTSVLCIAKGELASLEKMAHVVIKVVDVVGVPEKGGEESLVMNLE